MRIREELKWALLLTLVVSTIVVAGNIKNTWTGPQGQGDLQFERVSNGNIQARFGTTPRLDYTTIGGVSAAAGSFTTISASGDFTASSDIVLEKSTILRNDTISDVELIGTNAAANLGNLILDTSVDTASVGDNSYYSLVYRGPDSASNATDYVSIDGIITDETSTTEDSVLRVRTISGGSAVTNMLVGNDAIYPQVDDVVDLGKSGQEFDDLFIDGTANIDTLAADSGTVTGDLDVQDDLDVGGLFTIDRTALTVTNGQSVTVADSVYYVTSQGGANDTTNAVTLAAPTTAVGSFVMFVMTATSSNLMSIADSGTVASSGATVLDNNDTFLLYAVTTGLWVEVSHGDN